MGDNEYCVRPTLLPTATEGSSPPLFWTDTTGETRVIVIIILTNHNTTFQYRSDMSRQQAYNLMIECVKEVQKRLVINLPNFDVRVIDKDGVTKMETINPAVIAKAA